MTRKLLLVFLVGILMAGAIVYYKFFSAKTSFAAERKYFYVRTGHANRQAVLDALQSDSILSNTNDFEWLASRMDYWENIKPGRYQIKKGASVFDVAKKLRSGDHRIKRVVWEKWDASHEVF